MTLMIYGANGYTGELTARIAKEQGRAPILAGRTASKVRAVAERLGFEHRSFSLDDAKQVDAGLEGVDVVIHCAGPFSRTSKQMVDGCLRTKTHYLDVTGEIDVFEACAGRDAEAREAGVMVMPGTGFDVVPSDCLAVHLARQLPNATRLTMAFLGLGQVSHGTATTIVENLGRPSMVREDGRLTPIRNGSRVRRFDFGPRGERAAMAIPWGDLSTAYRSTRIPNIEVYMALPPAAIRGAWVSGFFPFLLRPGPVQKLLKSRVDAAPAGPTDAQRAKGGSFLWGEVENARGETARARLTVADGYTVTALASLIIAERALGADAPVGFQTPAKAYGPDLILEVPGSAREQL